jgi:hypothetical protein
MLNASSRECNNELCLVFSVAFRCICRCNQYTVLLDLHVDCLILLSDFNEIRIVLRDFSTNVQHLISRSPGSENSGVTYEEANGRLSQLN